MRDREFKYLSSSVSKHEGGKKCVLGAQAVILFFCIFLAQRAWIIGTHV